MAPMPCVHIQLGSWERAAAAHGLVTTFPEHLIGQALRIPRVSFRYELLQLCQLWVEGCVSM